MSRDFSAVVASRLTKKLSVCTDFLKIAGSYNGAFILEYCFYWSQHSKYHQKNTFYTKLQNIADKLSLSESTIKRGLKDLSEQGILSAKGGRASFKDKNDEYKKTKCLFITIYPEKINNLIEQIINKSHSGQNDLIEEFHSGQNDLIHGSGQNDLIQLQLQNTTTELLNPKKEKVEYQETYYPQVQPKPSTFEQGTPALRVTELAAMQNNEFNIPENLLIEWAITRRKKRSPINRTTWEQMNNQLGQCKVGGINPIEAFTKMVAFGWPALDAAQMLKHKGNAPADLDSMDWGHDVKEMW